MLLKYLLFFLYAYLPFQVALNPAPGFDVATVRILIPLATILWLTKSLRDKSLFIPRTAVACLLLSFLGMAFFSLFYAQNMVWGLRKLLFLSTILPLYFVLADLLRHSENRTALFFTLVSSSWALSLVGIFQFLLQFFVGIDNAQTFWAKHIVRPFLGNSFAETVLKYPSWLVHIADKDYFRVIATFPDPHMLAFFLNMVLPFALMGFASQPAKRWFYGLASLSIFIASILTFSRGGYLGLVFALTVGIASYFKSSLRKSNKGFLLVLLFVFSLILMTNNPIKNRFASSFDKNDGSNQGRMVIWKQTWDIIGKNPQGLGIGNYALAVLPTATYRDPIYAHNIYLDIAAEIGILGLLCWLGLAAAAFWRFWQKRQAQPLAFAGLLSLVVFASHGLVENPLFSIHVLVLFMLILALSSQPSYETD